MTKDLLINLFRTPWFVLILYSLVSGIAASLGRSGFGVLHALSPQYPSMAIWFFVGIVGILKNFDFKKFYFAHTLFPYFLLTITLLAYPTGIKQMNELKKRCVEGAHTVSLLPLIPQNPLFKWNQHYGLHPNGNHPLTERIEDLVSSNLVDVKLYDKHKLNFNLTKKNKGLGGYFSYISHKNHTEYWGWAFVPNAEKPADFIIICKEQNGKQVPFTSLLLNEKRPDVSKALNAYNHDDLWGFRKKIYHNSHTTPITVIAVNSTTLECFPLKLEFSQSIKEINNQL